MPQFDVELNVSPDTLQCIDNNVGVSKNEAVANKVSTRLQRKNKDWFKERQKKIDILIIWKGDQSKGEYCSCINRPFYSSQRHIGNVTAHT